MRTLYTKYHDKMQRILKSDSDYGYVDAKVFSNYFVKRIHKEENFKLYNYTKVHDGFELENIYLSQNGDMNDIFEGIPGDCYDRVPDYDIIEHIKDFCYLKCFSESENDTIMWGHYADSGKGICIEYDLKLLSQNSKILSSLFPVYYDTERKLKTLLAECASEEKNLWQKDAKHLLWIKDKRWKSEKEWRIILTDDICEYECVKKASNLYKANFDCVTSVTLGPRISDTDEKIVKKEIERLNKTKGKNIRLYKTELHPTKFLINKNEESSSINT